LPWNDHRDGVGGGGAERQADKNPTVSRSHVECETDQDSDDRGPTEKHTDLNGDRAEAELESCVAIVRRSRAEGCVQTS
jgi:hypothetical protein